MCTPFGLTTSERGLDCWVRKQYEHNLCFSLMNFSYRRSHDPVLWQRRGRPNAGKFFATFYLFNFTCCFWILGCLFPVWLMLCSAVHHRSLSLNWMKKKKLARKAAFVFTQKPSHSCSGCRILHIASGAFKSISCALRNISSMILRWPMTGRASHTPQKEQWCVQVLGSGTLSLHAGQKQTERRSVPCTNMHSEEAERRTEVARWQQEGFYSRGSLLARVHLRADDMWEHWGGAFHWTNCLFTSTAPIPWCHWVRETLPPLC